MNYAPKRKSDEKHRRKIVDLKNDFLPEDFDPPRKEFLPDNFVPGNSDVIVGRGRKCYDHVGNKILYCIIKCNLEEYSTSTCKIKKSNILSSITAQIRKCGRFVKEDTKTGRWYDVGDKLAREKISQAFRNDLHEKYRSSVLFKKNKRMEKKTDSYSGTHNHILQYHIERIHNLSERRQHLLKSQKINTLDCGPPSSLALNAEGTSIRNLLLEKTNQLKPERISRTYQIEDNPFEPTPISEYGPFTLIPNTPISEYDPFKLISNAACNRKGDEFCESIKLSEGKGRYCFENMQACNRKGDDFCESIKLSDGKDRFCFETMQACNRKGFDFFEPIKLSGGKDRHCFESIQLADEREGECHKLTQS